MASESADCYGRETKKQCVRVCDPNQPLAQRIYENVVKAYPLQAGQIVFQMMKGDLASLQVLADSPESQQAACKTLVAQLAANDVEVDASTLFRVAETVVSLE